MEEGDSPECEPSLLTLELILLDLSWIRIPKIEAEHKLVPTVCFKVLDFPLVMFSPAQPSQPPQPLDNVVYNQGKCCVFSSGLARLSQQFRTYPIYSFLMDTGVQPAPMVAFGAFPLHAVLDDVERFATDRSNGPTVSAQHGQAYLRNTKGKRVAWISFALRLSCLSDAAAGAANPCPRLPERSTDAAVRSDSGPLPSEESGEQERAVRGRARAARKLALKPGGDAAQLSAPGARQRAARASQALQLHKLSHTEGPCLQKSAHIEGPHLQKLAYAEGPYLQKSVHTEGPHLQKSAHNDGLQLQKLHHADGPHLRKFPHTESLQLQTLPHSETYGPRQGDQKYWQLSPTEERDSDKAAPQQQGWRRRGPAEHQSGDAWPAAAVQARPADGHPAAPPPPRASSWVGGGWTEPRASPPRSGTSSLAAGGGDAAGGGSCWQAPLDSEAESVSEASSGPIVTRLIQELAAMQRAAAESRDAAVQTKTLTELIPRRLMVRPRVRSARPRRTRVRRTRPLSHISEEAVTEGFARRRATGGRPPPDTTAVDRLMRGQPVSAGVTGAAAAAAVRRRHSPAARLRPVTLTRTAQLRLAKHLPDVRHDLHAEEYGRRRDRWLVAQRRRQEATGRRRRLSPHRVGEALRSREPLRPPVPLLMSESPRRARSGGRRGGKRSARQPPPQTQSPVRCASVGVQHDPAVAEGAGRGPGVGDAATGRRRAGERHQRSPTERAVSVDTRSPPTSFSEPRLSVSSRPRSARQSPLSARQSAAVLQHPPSSPPTPAAQLPPARSPARAEQRPPPEASAAEPLGNGSLSNTRPVSAGPSGDPTDSSRRWTPEHPEQQPGASLGHRSSAESSHKANSESTHTGRHDRDLTPNRDESAAGAVSVGAAAADSASAGPAAPDRTPSEVTSCVVASSSAAVSVQEENTVSKTSATQTSVQSGSGDSSGESSGSSGQTSSSGSQSSSGDGSDSTSASSSTLQRSESVHASPQLKTKKLSAAPALAAGASKPGAGLDTTYVTVAKPRSTARSGAGQSDPDPSGSRGRTGAPAVGAAGKQKGKPTPTAAMAADARRDSGGAVLSRPPTLTRARSRSRSLSRDSEEIEARIAMYLKQSEKQQQKQQQEGQSQQQQAGPPAGGWLKSSPAAPVAGPGAAASSWLKAWKVDEGPQPAASRPVAPRQAAAAGLNTDSVSSYVPSDMEGISFSDVSPP